MPWANIVRACLVLVGSFATGALAPAKLLVLLVKDVGAAPTVPAT